MGFRISLRLACIAMLPAVLGGCGLMFMQGPPAGHEQMNHFTCSNGNVGFIIDFVGAGVAASAAHAAANEPPYIIPNAPILAVGVVAAVAAGVSGVVGIVKTKKCGDALQALEFRNARSGYVESPHSPIDIFVKSVFVTPSVDGDW